MSNSRELDPFNGPPNRVDRHGRVTVEFYGWDNRSNEAHHATVTQGRKFWNFTGKRVVQRATEFAADRVMDDHVRLLRKRLAAMVRDYSSDAPGEFACRLDRACRAFMTLQNKTVGTMEYESTFTAD